MPDLKDTVATCFEQVAFFFPGGNPKLPDSFERRAAQLDTRKFARLELVKALKEYHHHLGSGKKVFENISFLLEEKTVAVVTGQQAGFLSGPLYTLYKALTAIRLAEEQALKLGRPVVPIFWIASEDHDWAEIRETVLINQGGKPMTCRLPGEGQGISIGQIPVPAWAEIESQLEEALAQGEFRREVLQNIKQFTERAQNLAEWFALILQWLVGDKGLIFFDPLLPEFKRLASLLYEDIIKVHQDVRAALQRRTEQWVGLGYSAQIETNGEEVHLFRAEPERRALLWETGGFYLRGKKEHFSLDQLCREVQEVPVRFSPNVVTRPIVQEYLLPVLAYVPGPGELNYWAQLGEVFEVFGLSMPILFPRLTAVVLLPGWHKALAKEGLTVTQVYQGLSAHRERCVRAQDDLAIEARFQRLRDQIREAYAELVPLTELNANIPEWVRQNQDKVEGQITYLEKKMWQALRKRCEDLLKHLQQLEDGIAPHGIKQERIVNPLSFVARIGLAFTDQISSLPIRADFREQELVLDFC